MKYYTLLLMLFCANTIFSQQMFNIGDTWILDFYVYTENINPNKIVTRTKSITVVKDTFINNNTYAYIVAEEAHHCGIFTEENFLRDDGGRIFKYSSKTDIEALVYDYSLTSSVYNIEFTNFDQAYYNTALVEIDSSSIFTAYDGTQINAQFSKIINNLSYDDNHQYMFLEGIGFKEFMPNLGTGLCDVFNDDNFGSLRCFVSQGDTIHFTQYDCNEKVVNLLDATYNISINNRYKVFPNPTDNVINIEGDFDHAHLYSLAGQKITTYIDGSKIYLPQYLSGIHILVISHNGETFFEKIILE